MSKFIDIYNNEDNQYRLRQSKIGCVLAIILMPAGLLIDFTLYPHLLNEFLLLRLGFSLITCFILLAHFTKLGIKHIKKFVLLWITLVQITLCTMIYMAEGPASPYYAGLNLMILAVGVLLAISFKEAIAVSLITLVIYLIACKLHGNIFEHNKIFINNIYFLILTCIISTTASYFNAKQRLAKFQLSYELKRRNKELAELDELKSQFIANVSHELRTPLTLILAPIQKLIDEEQTLSKPIKKSLGVVKNNALRLLNLVNDLLYVIRLNESQNDLEKKPIDLNKLINGIIESALHLAKQQNIKIHKTLESNSMINGDPHALEKVFLNLLSNAIKFTPQNGHISITSKRNDKSMTIAVQDTGQGIDKQSLPHIFDRFCQADGSPTRKQQGTGIGLALVKEIIDKHNGFIRVNSEINKGTTFTIILPNQPDISKTISDDLPKSDRYNKMFREADYICFKPKPVDIKNQQPNMINHDSSVPKILIIDDEEDMREYISSIFKEDYQVLEASDGNIGLQLANNYKPNLIILDLMLPGTDGLEICKILKNNSATQSIKIILLTARADETSKITALNNGADDYLTKPFSTLEILTRVKNLLKIAALQHDIKILMLERDLINKQNKLEKTLNKLSYTENKLFQSEKLNAIGHLTTGLMHEINNPLNYSLTAIQLAKKQLKNNPAVNDVLEDVYQGMDRIKNITTDLRSFAHPEKMNCQQEVSLQAIIQHALTMTSYELKPVTIDNQADDVIIFGSENHLIQVFINLFTNSANALEKIKTIREPVIKIISSCHDDRITVSVQDNGPGIPNDKLSCIFDPFFTTNDVGEGMGLGLSICHTIIENHGSTIHVMSEPDQWTTFSFDLPLAMEEKYGSLS